MRSRNVKKIHTAGDFKTKGADTRIHSTAFCDLSVSNCNVYIPKGFRDEDILRNQRFEKINVKYLDEIPYKG